MAWGSATLADFPRIAKAGPVQANEAALTLRAVAAREADLQNDRWYRDYDEAIEAAIDQSPTPTFVRTRLKAAGFE